MATVTAQELRDIVADRVKPTIAVHRRSRVLSDPSYVSPDSDDPSDEELDDFLLSNPLLDGETVSQLTDPGLLGFSGRTAEASEDWLDEFRADVESWADTREWQGADLVPYHILAMFGDPVPRRKIWRPGEESGSLISFVSGSPGHLLLAERLIREGRLLSELHWRDFEKLIGDLLATDGWTVTLMKGTKDGGIDVHSERIDTLLGRVKAIWQAKKYAEDHKVQLRHLRELSGVLDRERATKGVIVTTSSLTKGALEWVKRDEYRLEAKDGRFVETWVKKRLGDT